MADENKTPKMARPGLAEQQARKKQDKKKTGGLGSLPGKKKYVHKEHNKAFPGDFKNFTESKEFKDSKKATVDKLNKDSQHPVKGKHAGFQFLMDSGKKEMESFKKYRKNRAETRDRNKPSSRSTDVEAVMLKKGGRAGYKYGKSVKKKGGCAIKGKSPILR